MVFIGRMGMAIFLQMSLRLFSVVMIRFRFLSGMR